MYKLFQNNIKQLNVGDVQGTLFNTFNCDLTYNKGKMSVAPRTRITTNTITNMGTPCAFAFYNGLYYSIMGTRLFKASNPQGAFTVVTAGVGSTYAAPTDCDSRYSDLTVFNGQLIISTESAIYRMDTLELFDKIDGVSPLSSATVRPVTVYNNRLYYTRLPYTIVSCDTTYAISSTAASAYNITLSPSSEVTFIESHSVGLYIGTTRTDSTEGEVVDWNGETKNTPRAEYNVYAQGALSAYVDNRLFYVMNSDAILLQFNGGKFVEVARLPIRRNALFNANATGSTGSDRFIHPNGMTLIDNNLSLLINATNNDGSGTQEENIHSGIWEFIDSKSYTQNNITYSSGGSLYHKYSMSYNTIGGTQTDNGQIILKGVGALYNTYDLSSFSNAQKGNFLAGASFYSDATTVGYGAFTDNYFDDEQKAGFFSTVQLRAENFEDMWQRVTTLYTPSNSFNFVWKYRKKRTDHIDFTITWVSTTTFTTTQVGIVEGDEITIIQGKGGGRVAHVVGTPTFSSPNYTVTLDEAIINVSGTAKARLQKWKKIGIINNIDRFYQEVVIGNPSTLIELKCAMVAISEATIDELILDNKLNK
jgi:hypothetical protein